MIVVEAIRIPVIQKYLMIWKHAYAVLLSEKISKQYIV